MSKKRDDLLDLLRKFEMEAKRYLGVDAYSEISRYILEQTDDFDENGDPIVPGTVPTLNTPADIWPELLVVPMPLVLPLASPHRTQLAGLIKTEFELRKGHANDCLGSIRQIIGHQSFQFKNLLRPATDKVHHTRARTSIQHVYRELTLKAQIYRRTRQGLESLGLEPELLITTYRILDKDDLKVSAAVGNPNQAGISQTSLSWIWTTIHGPLSADNYLMECTEFNNLWFQSLVNITSVYRVHWLRVQARFHRWAEELTVTKNEMEWTTHFFFTKAREWDAYLAPGLRSGQIAYAERQKAMWLAMGEEARKQFLKIRPDAHSRLHSII